MTKNEVIEKYNLVNLAEYDYYHFNRWGWRIGNMSFIVINDFYNDDKANFYHSFKIDKTQHDGVNIGLPRSVNLNKDLFCGKLIKSVKDKWIDQVLTAYRKDVEKYINELNESIAKYEKEFLNRD